MNNLPEKEIENIIMSNLDKMPSRGLDIFYKNTINQISFKSCIADIFTWEEIDDVLHCRIIELKKSQVDESAFWQVFNYKVDLFLFVLDKYKHIKDIKIDIVLIGYSFNENVEFISNYAGLMLYEYKYNINGISFEKKNFDFNDNMISEMYQVNKLKIEESQERKSFTGDLLKLIRDGKI